ncbi:ribonuclease HI family protein [Patescibacteria group bacterium]|nr:ribonuclease HI family protein [Patescibacteria group bacterium]
MARRLTVFADGGARGNPGPAATGFVVKDSSGKIIHQQGKFIGKATNNVAEYQAVIEALKWIKSSIQYPVSSIQFFLDSKLIVNQLNGLFKVKEIKMRNLIIKVRQLEREVGGNVSYQTIPREKNSLADGLVNQAIDKRLFHRAKCDLIN